MGFIEENCFEILRSKMFLVFENNNFGFFGGDEYK